ncbi:phosphocholine cytidylyltransferase family protein [Archaeoglobus neptunius]|uniref:phosphocholine cytidylyltransferase family protein n=1 Tax=Archaeoglobus neptunius TaxID=2798580 RepID=UPI001928983C|nr:NTP transferase domain-containing protein [Archaeoglobus neptunius]
MEAVILAAGFGSRLGHHTREIPKALLKIGKKPLIYYTINTLMKNGIEDVIIVTGHKGYVLKDYLSGFDMNFKFVHNSLYKRTNNIYSLYLAMDHVSSGFYILNSDVLFHPEIFTYIHQNEDDSLVLSVDNVKKLGEEEMKVQISDGVVKRISKQIPPNKADGEYIGIAKVHRNTVDDLKEHVTKVMDKKGRKVFYEEAFQSMMDSGHEVYCEFTRGLPWIEIDTPSDLMAARYEIFPNIKAPEGQ